jgi:hypothetical protein
MLLRDEISISILDIEQEKVFIISHSEFNIILSPKGAMPTLNSIAIKWIDSNANLEDEFEPLIKSLTIFST